MKVMLLNNLLLVKLSFQGISSIRRSLIDFERLSNSV